MLRRQLYKIFVTILLIPAVVIGSYMLIYNYNMIYDNHKDMLKSDNLRIRSILYDVTTSLTNACEIISRDQGLQELLSKKYDGANSAMKAMTNFTFLKEINSRYTEISSLKVYTDSEYLSSYEHISVVEDEERDWFYEVLQNPGDQWGTRTYTDKYNNIYKELQVVHPIIISDSDVKAVLVVSISGNYLKNRIRNNTLNVDIAVNSEPIFFSTMGNEGSEIDYNFDNAASFTSFTGVKSYNNEKVLIEASAIKPVMTDDYIHIFSIDNAAVNRLAGLLQTEILIIALSILVPTIIIVIYTRQLTFRITTLRTSMRRVTSGDYNIVDYFYGNDELADLFDDLKIMIKSIKERDQKIYESSLEEHRLISHQKSMEFQLLSSKINPHFLYNTLETIRMKSFNSGNKDVATAIKLLGKYMRYNLESSGELKPLSEEIEYIRIYLEIQTLRFGDRIGYSIELEDNLDIGQLNILPLLIQPLVENALLHGHDETMENGMIWIRCFVKNKMLRIEIEDNGVGMSDEELEKVLTKINAVDAPNKNSFGLYNIQHRLLLLYGEQSSLTFEANQNVGSCIGFSIPLSQMERKLEC